MIPIIYSATENSFTSNGLFRLVDCISCEVTEERNGIYEVEFKYPTTGAHYEDIEEGQIIYTTHDESGIPQPFDIYKRSVPIDGIVTFNACHISYRLRNIILHPFTAASCADTFAAIPTNTVVPCPFTFWTDKTVVSEYKLSTPRSVREVLGGTQGSILDVYGTGEYEFDKFAVKFFLHRGHDSNVSIRYGKNLISITDETDAGDVYNAVVPYWEGNDGTLVTVAGYVVTASDYHEGDPVVPVVLDLSAQFEEAPTVEELEAVAQSKIDADDVRKGTRTIKVDFVQLWQTEEYKDIAPLEHLALCDTVEVVYGDVKTYQKINKVVYDSLLERYSSMELGTTTQTLAEAMTSVMEKALVEPMMREVDKEISGAVRTATDLITGVDGGYVILMRDANGHPYELLVCDSPDYLTARNVWRWNQNGLGFSSTGYLGPYGTAMTSDGHIVASFIDTGIIQALSGRTYWNLNTGDFYNFSADPTSRSYRALRIKDGQIFVYNSPTESFGRLMFNVGVTNFTMDGAQYTGTVFGAAGKRLTFGYYTSGQSYNNAIDILGYDERWYTRHPDDTSQETFDNWTSERYEGTRLLIHNALLDGYLRIGKRNGGTLTELLQISGFVQASAPYQPMVYLTPLIYDLKIVLGSQEKQYASFSYWDGLRLGDNMHFRMSKGQFQITDGSITIEKGHLNLNAGSATISGYVRAGESLQSDKGLTLWGGNANIETGDLYVKAGDIHCASSNIYAGSGTLQIKRVELTDTTASVTLCGASFTKSGVTRKIGECFSDFFGKYSTSANTLQGLFVHPPAEWTGSIGQTFANMISGSLYCSQSVYVYLTMSAQTVTQRSDSRLKDRLEWDDSLDSLLDRLEVVKFKWKESDGMEHVGLIAQDVEEQMESLGISDMFVSQSGEEGYKELNYSELSVLLLKKVQDQQKHINDLETRLARLEALVEGLNV